MSFELTLVAGDSELFPSLEEFAKFFSGRFDRFEWLQDDIPAYEINSTQAYYENEKTSVSFLFDYCSEAEDPKDSRQFPNIQFSMSSLCPHFYALEAGYELQALVNAFDLRLFDESEGKIVKFDFELFIDYWSQACDFAVKSLGGTNGFDVVGRELLEDAWLWNRAIPDMYESSFGAYSAFIPRISIFKQRRTYYSAIIWGDAMAVRIPVVDYILVCRREIDNLPRDRLNQSLVSRSDLLDILVDFPVVYEPYEHVLVDYESPPHELVDRIRNLKIHKGSVRFLNYGEILSGS